MKFSKKTKKLAKLLAIQEKLEHAKSNESKKEEWRTAWVNDLLKNERQTHRQN